MSDATSDAGDSEADVVYQIRDVHKGFPLPGGERLTVLRGVNLEVRRGEFLVVEGRSGVGKSTLLHLMGLMDRPDQGQLWIEGREVSRISKRARAALRARRIGYVFQFFHLLPEFTAIENVLMPAIISASLLQWPARRRAARARAAELLDAVGLGDRMRHRPNQLSGGERQRVALARALVSDPAVVLCDEPTGNLDVKTSESIHELLARLNRATRQTMVVVTHDAGLADYASRLVHLQVEGLAEGGLAAAAAGE